MRSLGRRNKNTYALYINRVRRLGASFKPSRPDIVDGPEIFADLVGLKNKIAEAKYTRA
jgi:hypothetical protein